MFMLLSVHVTSVLFLVQFNNFALTVTSVLFLEQFNNFTLTMGFY